MSDGREEREEQEKRREWEREKRRPDDDRIPDEDDWGPERSFWKAPGSSMPTPPPTGAAADAAAQGFREQCGGGARGLRRAGDCADVPSREGGRSALQRAVRPAS